MNKKPAFSLVELLISLIIISLIIAAFVPVITKKKRSLIVTSAKEETNLTNDCKIFSSPEYVEGGMCETCGNCTLCDGKKYCINCEGKVCNTDNQESLDNKTCRCISCKNHDSNCTVCTSDTCTECAYGKYPSGKKCVDCPEPCSDCTDKNICSECKAGYYLIEGKCLPCPSGTYNDKNNSENSCTKCPANHYNDTIGATSIDSCKKCPVDKCSNEGATSCRTCIENCTIYNDTGCAQCEDGYYGITTQCLKCGVKHCKKCTNNNTCSECFSGYHIDETSPNYCYPNITTRNAGDEGGPKLPSGVQICQTGTICNVGSDYSVPTCWKGGTAASMTCTTLDNYSGCNRTLCNWHAAKAICAYNNMYLPSNEQWNALRNNSTTTGRYIGLLSQGMCDWGHHYANKSPMCSGYASCRGSQGSQIGNGIDGYCFAGIYWGAETDGGIARYNLSNNQLYGPKVETTKGSAYSVRCAWD